MAGVMISAFESPIKISAPSNASSNVCTSILVANSAFCTVRLSRSDLIMPLLSVIIMFSGDTPKARYSRAQEMAAAPAPLITIFTFDNSFSANSTALSKAAPEIMAVPCWSSCITGMLSSSTSLRSISKASGALMSSRLMPPNVGAIFFTVATKASTSLVSTSMSKTSMPANILKSNPLPSITGLEASGPISPNPNTAVPFEITATKLALLVYL